MYLGPKVGDVSFGVYVDEHDAAVVHVLLEVIEARLYVTHTTSGVV